MTDTKKLRELISSRGLKLVYIAGQLQITPRALGMKLDNASQFKADEIARLSEVLGISTAEERDSIFFCSRGRKIINLTGKKEGTA